LERSIDELAGHHRGFDRLEENPSAGRKGAALKDQVIGELWVSLASLLRSYTAAHGLNGNRQATVELGEGQITVRHGNAWLDLRRNGPLLTWARDNGRNGDLELMETGYLRSSTGEQALDMAAEAWARELMQ